MKKRFKLAAIFAAAMFAGAPVVGLAETSTTVSADTDIMQQYTFNDSGLDFTHTLKVYIAKGHKFTTSKLKRDTKKYLGNDVPETISNQFLDLKYRGTAYQRVYKNGKAYKGKYLTKGKYKVVTGLVYEVAAKSDQSQVSTGPAYINGKKVNATILTGQTSGDEIIGIVYPMTSKATVYKAK